MQGDIESGLRFSSGFMSSLETNRQNTIPTVETIRIVANAVDADVDTAVALVRLYRTIGQTHGKFRARNLRVALDAVSSWIGK